jgi:hypothetical protein
MLIHPLWIIHDRIEVSQCVIVARFSPYTSFRFMIRFDFASGPLVTRGSALDWSLQPDVVN